MLLEHNYFQKFFYGLGTFGKEIIYWIVSLVYIIYLNELNVSTTFIIFLVLFSKLISAFLDPLIGLIIDNTKSFLSKFKFWILVGALTTLISTIMLFYAHNIDKDYLYHYIILSSSLWFISFSFTEIAVNTLILTFGSHNKKRESLSVIYWLSSLIAAEIIIIYKESLLEFCASICFSHDNYLIFALIAGFFFLITQLVLVFKLKESHIYHSAKKFLFSSIYKVIFDNDQIKVVILICFIHQSIWWLMTALIFYMAKYLDISDYTNLIVYSSLAQALGVFSYLVFRKFLSRQLIFILSLLATALLSLSVLFCLQSALLILNVVLISAASFFFALSLVATNIMFADCCDYGEFKIGTRSDSILFSMQSFCYKLSYISIALMTGLSISISSTLPKSLVSSTDEISISFYLIVIAILCIFLTLIYKRYYKLDHKFFTKALNLIDGLRNRATVSYDKKLLLRFALNKENILFHPKNINSIDDLLESFAHNLNKHNIIDDEKAFIEAIKEQNLKNDCILEDGLALPQIKSRLIKRSTIAIAILDKGIVCHATNNKECDLVFLIVSEDNSFIHINLIGRLCLLLNDIHFHDILRECRHENEVIDRLLYTSTKLLKRNLYEN